MVIIVKPGDILGVYGKKFAKFIDFAKKKLGNRLILVNQSVLKTSIPLEIKGRGFRLNKRALSGMSFGEYFDACVITQTDYLKDQLRKSIGKTPRIKRKAALSLRERWTYFTDYSSRKQALKERRK